MKSRAFTLIELLVVVLIIGILSAIALPQYQKAIVKSRLATIQPLLAAIKTAEEEYYMVNGTYTSDLSNLSIGTSCEVVIDDVFRCDNYFAMDPLNGNDPNIRALYCPAHITNWSNCEANRDFTYTVWFDHSDYLGQTTCSGNTSLGTKICAGM